MGYIGIYSPTVKFERNDPAAHVKLYTVAA
jgi:hypothetical protein